MQDFRELKVWQKAHELTLRLYRTTTAFPVDERFGLTSQIRRAAASIGANIAEGCCRGTRRDMARFLQIAAGSAGEIEYLVILAKDLDLLKAQAFSGFVRDTREVKRMLAGLISKVRSAAESEQPHRRSRPSARASD